MPCIAVLQLYGMLSFGNTARANCEHLDEYLLTADSTAFVSLSVAFSTWTYLRHRAKWRTACALPFGCTINQQIQYALLLLGMYRPVAGCMGSYL